MGAEADTGSRNTPRCPATPMAAAVEAPITASVAKIPANVLRKRMIAMTNVPNMSGITNPASRVGASANAQFSIAIPAAWISTSGYSVRYRSSSPRTCSTVAGSSASDSPGSEIRTFTPAVRASAETSRPARSGSVVATWRARATRAGVISPVPTRSSTISSSPSAQVCWKFVIPSTRVEFGICQASSVNDRIIPSMRGVNTSPSSGRITNSTLSFLV